MHVVGVCIIWWFDLAACIWSSSNWPRKWCMEGMMMDIWVSQSIVVPVSSHLRSLLCSTYKFHLSMLWIYLSGEILLIVGSPITIRVSSYIRWVVLLLQAYFVLPFCSVGLTLHLLYVMCIGQLQGVVHIWISSNCWYPVSLDPSVLGCQRTFCLFLYCLSSHLQFILSPCQTKSCVVTGFVVENVLDLMLGACLGPIHCQVGVLLLLGCK